MYAYVTGKEKANLSSNSNQNAAETGKKSSGCFSCVKKNKDEKDVYQKK